MVKDNPSGRGGGGSRGERISGVWPRLAGSSSTLGAVEGDQLWNHQRGGSRAEDTQRESERERDE